MMGIKRVGCSHDVHVCVRCGVRCDEVSGLEDRFAGRSTGRREGTTTRAKGRVGRTESASQWSNVSLMLR